MRIHFIAGLPRSGSTLLAALLKQNPLCHVLVHSPVNRIFNAVRTGVSELESPLAITKEQRIRLLNGVFDGYFADVTSELIIDSHRYWHYELAALDMLRPEARVVCCVRSPAWILDSTERLVRKNPIQCARMMGNAVCQSVYDRIEQMMGPHYLGGPMRGFRQAWFGEYAKKLIVVRYDSLAERPGDTMSKLYALLGEAPFGHDFDNVAHEEPDLDRHFGVPGMHTVRGPIALRRRETILPPEVFRQYDNSFWDQPANNPRNVSVI